MPVEPVKKLDLLETGTRFQHYNELLDTFRDGIETISNMRPNLRNEADETLKQRLLNAVNVIERRMNYLASYDKGELALMKVVNSIPANKPLQLTEGSQEKQCQASSEPSS